MNLHRERLDGVAPVIRGAVLQLCDLSASRLAQPLMIVQGWRSVSEQLQAYQRGRMFNRESGEWEILDPNVLVTRAKPGTSPHNVVTRDTGRPASLAVDVVPLTPAGLPDWEIHEVFWDDLYELAWRCGLDPLGDPIGSYYAGDKGHFEEPSWKLKLDGLGLILPLAEVQRV